ncbi:MAG: hypothetical protein ACM3TR_07540 [Caulobacteraceae bacterium]
MKRFLVFVCLLSITVLLSGCWNYREVEKLAIVLDLAIDRGADKYLVTNEVINIKGSRRLK